MEYIINKNLKGKVLQENTTHALLLLPNGSRIVYAKTGLKKAVDSGSTAETFAVSRPKAKNTTILTLFN